MSMRKFGGLVAFMAVMCMLTGCQKSVSMDENGLSADKKGVITGSAVEAFDSDYLKEGELKSMIDQEIRDYNAKTGKDSVELSKFKVYGGKAKALLTYQTGKDYAAFNNLLFFQGSIAEAQEAGYDFSLNFQKVNKGKAGDTAAASEVISDTQYKVLILEEPVQVITPTDIVYVSSNVEVNGKREAKIKSGTEEAESPAKTDGSPSEKMSDGSLTGYIIYK